MACSPGPPGAGWGHQPREAPAPWSAPWPRSQQPQPAAASALLAPPAVSGPPLHMLCAVPHTPGLGCPPCPAPLGPLVVGPLLVLQWTLGPAAGWSGFVPSYRGLLVAPDALPQGRQQRPLSSSAGHTEPTGHTGLQPCGRLASPAQWPWGIWGREESETGCWYGRRPLAARPASAGHVLRCSCLQEPGGMPACCPHGHWASKPRGCWAAVLDKQLCGERSQYQRVPCQDGDRGWACQGCRMQEWRRTVPGADRWPCGSS